MGRPPTDDPKGWFVLTRLSGLFRSYFNARFEALVAEIRELRQELAGNAAEPRPAATSFADAVGTRLAEVVREPFDNQHDDLMAALALVARSVDQTADAVTELQERLSGGDVDTAPQNAPRATTKAGAAVPASTDAIDLDRHWPLEALDQPLADVANYAASHNGWAAQAGLWFNPPVSVEHRPGGVVARDVNERIAEVPFVFRALAGLPTDARVLHLGGRESTVPLSLASLGYDVVVVAPEGYPLAHAHLKAVSTPGDLLAEEPFDAAVLLSAARGVDAAVLDTVWSALRPGGMLVLTAAVGVRAPGEAGSPLSSHHVADVPEARWTVVHRSAVAKVGPTEWQHVDAAPRGEVGHENGYVVLLAANKVDI